MRINRPNEAKRDLSEVLKSVYCPMDYDMNSRLLDLNL